MSADLSRLLLLAFVDKLEQRCPLPPLPLTELPVRAPRLDDTGRAPIVPLWPTGGDRA